MSIAPSERHLEDWIVAHPYWMTEFFEVQTIGRQVRLPSGIADLITSNSGRQIQLLELKRGALDAKALAQVLRYAADIRRIWRAVKVEHEEDYRLDYFNYVERVGAYLIGHSIDRDILTAALAANVVPLVYRYDQQNDTYTFKNLMYSYQEARQDVIEEYAYGYLGQAMRRIKLECVE